MFMRGKEIKQFQTEWQNISFYDMKIKLNNDLPSSDFYNLFYKLLFNKYSKFDDLPKDWLLEKEKSADNIKKFLKTEDSILSYGCGLGYVEHILFKKYKKLNVFDFSSISSKWLINKNKNINFLTKLDGKYDCIYLQQVLYALNYSDCVSLINMLKINLNENGKIVLTHTSIIPLENGINFNNFIQTLKSFIRPIYHLFKDTNNKTGQFWGWQRDNKRYISIVNDSNMKVSEIFTSTNGSNESIIIIEKASS